MFGLFKRTKIKQWEIDLLKRIGRELSKECGYVLQQVEAGLLRGVLVGLSDIPNYVGFSYNHDVYKRFYNEEGRNFAIKNIQVFNVRENKYTDFDMYISSGMINGYATPKSGKFEPDVEKINVTGFQKVYVGNPEFEKIRNLLDDSDMQLIKPEEVYQINLEGETYFHIKDIGDGDFIGIDMRKNVYKITHDPYGVSMLTTGITDSLKSYV